MAAIAALVTSVGQPSSTAAENDLYVAIRYSIDDSTRGCWDENEFRRRVTQRIGYDPFREDAPVNVKVRVGGAPNAVDGSVEWRKANGALMGERRFVAKDGDCRDLLTEMTFSVGLQIELLRPKAVADTKAGPHPKEANPPDAAAGTSTPSGRDFFASPPTKGPTPPGPPDRAEEKAAKDTKSASPGTEPPSATASSWPIWIGIGPSVARGLSPAITADARLFLGIRQANVSLEMAGEATYPSTQSRWNHSGFRQTLVGGSLAVCGHLQWLSVCGLGRISEVRATGLGVTKPRSPTGFVAHAGLRIAGTISLGQTWSLAGHVDGLGLLTPSRVELNGGVVWEMPRLGALAGVDLVAFFP